MQSVSSRIWTRVAVSISNDDNDYTTGTSLIMSGESWLAGSRLRLPDACAVEAQHLPYSCVRGPPDKYQQP